MVSRRVSKVISDTSENRFHSLMFQESLLHINGINARFYHTTYPRIYPTRGIGNLGGRR